jgi:hypothetical protein
MSGMYACVVNWVLSVLYLNETNMIKCYYVYSKTPLTQTRLIATNCIKNNIKNIMSKSKHSIKKGIKVASKPASRQQHVYLCSQSYNPSVIKVNNKPFVFLINIDKIQVRNSIQ